MFDLSTPIWVKGTVARYELIPPHLLITLEERNEDGHIQRWFVEGPPPHGLDRRGIEPELLKVGDAIETCAFALKEEFSTRGLLAHIDGSFVHGHVLVMPDGRLEDVGILRKDRQLRAAERSPGDVARLLEHRLVGAELLVQ